MEQVKMEQAKTEVKSVYWQEQREYFKTKTIAFKDMKKKREIEIMMKELNLKIKK